VSKLLYGSVEPTTPNVLQSEVHINLVDSIEDTSLPDLVCSLKLAGVLADWSGPGQCSYLKS